MDRKTTLGVIAEIASCTVFGFSFLGARVGLKYASVATLLAWRFCFAFLALQLLVWCGVFKVKLKGRDLRPLLLIALLQPVIYFLAETYGIARTSASESGTLMAFVPIMTLLLSRILFRESPTRFQWIGICASVLGVALIGFVKGASATLDLPGYALLLVAITSDGFYMIVSGRAAAYTSTEKTYMMALVGLIFFGGWALIEHTAAGTLGAFAALPFSCPPFLGAVVFLSLGSQIAGFWLCNYALGALGATRTSSFVGLCTVVSVAAGVLLLKEPFSLLQGAGTLLVLLGVYCANRLPGGVDSVKVAPAKESGTQEKER